MFRIVLSFALIAFGVLCSQAQSLYIPRNLQHAYKKETRSPDGRPGKNYWQNFARYNITVSAVPPNRNIKGSEQITYINRSPDTLKSLVFRLIQNIHKPEAQRHEDVDSAFFNSGIHIDSFSINGQAGNWVPAEDHFTRQTIDLSKPLLPLDSVQFFVAWHYEIPREGGREGMIDSTTFFLAYFYPRISVYDDYNGWDRLDFVESKEFYNDFNNYILQVNVPKNYIVWSTGMLQNPNEVLQPAYSQRLNESMSTDSTIHIVTTIDLVKKNITSQHSINTWQFKADDITDVTVGLSDHFVWDGGSVIADEASHRRVSVQAAYNDSAKDFHQAVQIARYALSWFSHQLPGVPYPYPKMTVFQGYYDMEYPMMVNDATTRSINSTKLVENHEIAHTYFPFYMGTNESRYAFMDEGWATTLEYLIARSQESPDAADALFKRFRINRWIHDPSQEEDLPIITPANEMTGAGYANNAYGKASLSYLALKDLLGDELFKKCLQEYMARWHDKHPTPWDFFNSISDASGKNLDWFWNNWFFSNNYIDLAIQNVNSTKHGKSVAIQNIGGFAVPVDLQLNYSDGSNEVIHESPEIWSSNQKQATITITTKKQVQTAQLIPGIFVDADDSNNSWKK